MLIVLTSEKALEHEAQQINGLFSLDLPILHLRKPDFSEEEYRQLLSEIKPQFYSRIMIHHSHALCKEFGLRGVHLQEQARRGLGEGLEEYVASYTEDNFCISSSFHSLEELETFAHFFEYVLLSPVFSSISKVGYEGKGFDVSPSRHKIVGMGGIQVQTIAKAKNLGYKGVGVLGGIWNSENPLESFLRINEELKKVYA